MSTVIEHLQRRGAAFLVLPWPAATTIEETARVHGIHPDELVRTHVVVSASGPMLIVQPAERELDIAAARKVLADPTARPATETELRSLAPDCETDAIPPLPLYLLTPMWVDPEAAAMAQWVFAAGRVSLLACMLREDINADDPFAIAPPLARPG